MKIVRTIPSRLIDVQVYGGAADIQEGAVVIPGSTDETDRGAVILGSGAAADAVGLLAQLFDYSVTGDYDDAGTVYKPTKCMPFLPGCEVAAEIDFATELATASGSTTACGVSSLEDDIEGGWTYVTTTPGVGQLAFNKAAGSNTVTFKSAITTGLTAGTSKVVITRPKFSYAHTLSSNATKIITSAAAGSLVWILLRTEMRYRGEEGWLEIDPTKHHNLQGLNSKQFKMRYIMSPRDTLHNPDN